MTKKEKHSAINREFFNAVENRFHIDDYGDGGRVTLSLMEDDYLIEDGSYHSDHYIEYHLSRHTVDCFKHAHDDIKHYTKQMEGILEDLIKKYDLQ